MSKQTPHTAYITKKRDEALTGRSPVLRMASAVMMTNKTDESFTSGELLRNNALVVSFRNGKLKVVDGHAVPQTVTGGLIQEHIKRGGSVIAVDRQSLTGLLRRLERLGDPMAKQTSYQLRANDRLPTSFYVGVLTELLNRKFWAPTKADTSVITSWRAALGVNDGVKGVLEMIEMVGDTSVPPDAKPPTVIDRAAKAISRSSAVVFNKAGSPSDEAAVASYAAAEDVGAAWSAMRAYDTVCRHEVATEGTSAFIEPFARDPQTSHVLAVVSQPCRIKSGRTIQILSTGNEQRLGVAELARLSFDPNKGLIGEFRPAPAAEGKTKTRSFTVLDRAVSSSETFIIAQEPFISNGPRLTRTSAWTRQAVNELGPVAGRNIPLDVAFAGGIG